MGEPDATGLDLSKESLPVLERLVLADFATREEVVAPERSEVRDQYVSYLGELFRRAAGGEWIVRPGEQDPDNPFIGNPYLRLGADMAKVPVSALRLLVRDRKPGTLQRTLDAYRS